MRRGARGERRGNYFYIKRWFLTDKAHREVRAHQFIYTSSAYADSYTTSTTPSGGGWLHIYDFLKHTCAPCI